jgi:hypothetical protein
MPMLLALTPQSGNVNRRVRKGAKNFWNDEQILKKRFQRQPAEDYQK